MIEIVEATLVTTTTYGSWLPGDARGYVERGEILPPSPKLSAFALQLMSADAVALSASEQSLAFEALVAAAKQFGYRLTDAVIEATHCHWIIGHEDPVATMTGRLKNRMRQALDRGRVWTAGYCGRRLQGTNAFSAAENYLARHPGARLIRGQRVSAPALPGGGPSFDAASTVTPPPGRAPGLNARHRSIHPDSAPGSAGGPPFV